MIESPTHRRAILAVLVLVVVACLGAVTAVVFLRGAGDGFALGYRLSSLKNDEVPGSTVRENREQVLSLSREFATRFNTYDPSMLDDNGHLPDYAAVEDLMTPKFGSVFSDNVGYAEQTVSQLKVASVATVYAVGVASQDDDSAVALVAGTIELSYPYPAEDRGKGRNGRGQSDDRGQGGEEDKRLSTGPQRFRYEVSLVKVDGKWLVDDLDDVDDGLPPFSQPSIPEDQPTTPDQTPSTTPSDSATTSPPAGSPTTGQTGKGKR